jgi:hypothetical protein
VGLARPVAGDPVPDAADDAPQRLRVDVEQLARPRALVAHHGRPRRQRREAPEAEAPQHVTDGADGQPEGVGDLRAAPAPRAELGNAPLEPRTGLPGRAMRPRAAVAEAPTPFGPIAPKPLPHRLHADSKGRRGLRHTPVLFEHTRDEADSPRKPEPRILVAVHSVLWQL